MERKLLKVECCEWDLVRLVKSANEDIKRKFETAQKAKAKYRLSIILPLLQCHNVVIASFRALQKAFGSLVRCGE
jgi:hypothetical protein